MTKWKFISAVLYSLFALSLIMQPAHAGWKTKAAMAAGTVIAGQAVKKCITTTCPKAVMGKIDDYLAKNPQYRDYLVGEFQKIAVNKYPHLLKSDKSKERYVEMLSRLRGSESRKSGVPSVDIDVHPSITKPFKRPAGSSPRKNQDDFVQGKPCVDCGNITKKQVADHKDPLVVEYYRDGVNDVSKQRLIDSVQPHCPKCSNQQGGQLSGFSRKMKKKLLEEKGE